jgi:hypothetical protein
MIVLQMEILELPMVPMKLASVRIVDTCGYLLLQKYESVAQSFVSALLQLVFIIISCDIIISISQTFFQKIFYGFVK